MSVSEQHELNRLLNCAKVKYRIRSNKAPKGRRPYYDDEEEEESFGSKTQWTTGDGVRYFAAGKTVSKLEPGVYEVKMSNTGLYFEKVPVKTEGLIEFPETNSQKVMTEIQNFWGKEEVFASQGLAYKRGIILWGPPGCHSAGTKVVLFDGSVKNVENVLVGDLLMGPDGKSRKVLETCRGKDDMYRISPTKGESFVVNGHHILHLNRSGKRDHVWLPDRINISVNDFLKLSKTSQRRWKLRHGDAVKKPNKNSLVTGIEKVEFLGAGDYYGFILSGDHLYMTDDFIVHHNSGKSCTIQLVIADVTNNRQGVVFKLNTDPTLFLEGIRVFREIQPHTPCVILMEDIDALIHTYDESEVLNILDGVDRIEKVVFLATTNYPEELGERIMNRPSRFDKRFKMPHPKPQSRRLYFEHLIARGTIDMPVDLDRWVNDTEGMSVAHLKELFIAVCILGEDYNDTIETLRAMVEERPTSHDDDEGFGFITK